MKVIEAYLLFAVNGDPPPTIITQALETIRLYILSIEILAFASVTAR
jgi:hypothetical protein